MLVGKEGGREGGERKEEEGQSGLCMASFSSYLAIHPRSTFGPGLEMPPPETWTLLSKKRH
jgi:hypothetical protein